MENENVWKTAVGYDGIYNISNNGDLKSLKRILVCKNGLWRLPERMMTPQLSREGYLCCLLTDVFKKKKTVKLHRLVAIAFIPNPENKPFINHINGIKTDNRIENLEWCTAKENIRHALKTGLNIPRKGSELTWSKLNEKDVLEIREIHNGNKKGYEATAFKYNVSSAQICSVVNRRTWKHI